MRRTVAAVLVAACLGSGATFALGDPHAVKAAAPAPRPTPTVRTLRPVAHPCSLPPDYRRAFERAARATQLPVPMLVAVGEVESDLNQRARSQAGAQGVLQVLPSTATALGLDSSQVAENVLAGASYLRQLLRRFDSVDLALAAYNAGPSAVEREGGAPTGETLTYVANVTARWRALLRCR